MTLDPEHRAQAVRALTELILAWTERTQTRTRTDVDLDEAA